MRRKRHTTAPPRWVRRIHDRSSSPPLLSSDCLLDDARVWLGREPTPRSVAEPSAGVGAPAIWSSRRPQAPQGEGSGHQGIAADGSGPAASPDRAGRPPGTVPDGPPRCGRSARIDSGRGIVVEGLRYLPRTTATCLAAFAQSVDDRSTAPHGSSRGCRAPPSGTTRPDTEASRPLTCCSDAGYRVIVLRVGGGIVITPAHAARITPALCPHGAGWRRRTPRTTRRPLRVLRSCDNSP